MTDKEVMQQALEFVEFLWREAVLNDYAEAKREETELALRAALAQQEQAEPVPPAQIIGYLESRRLVRLLQELDTVEWESDDDGWSGAIEAVCQRIDKELLEVVDWVKRKEVSEATMATLLQKMMGEAK